MDGELPVKPNMLGIFAEKPRTDGVKRPRPAQGACRDPGLVWQNICRDALDAADHLDGRSA
jgi:hypothetical protein